jgi:Tol biopolymer transport system component
VLRRFLVLCLVALFWGAPSVHAFGQNKVQYESFKWTYVRTEHFDIYFAQGGDQIGEFAARHIEEMYAKVSKITGHKLTERVPIILHNTHTEFQQTNVIPMALSEGIGGFTERFKNRIVLPFEGGYREFYQVLNHELVHAVVFNMLFGGPASGPVTRQYGGFPLWVNEGLAEYAAIGWDLGSEFFMIDATTFGYVAPPIADFGGFLAYKGGQLFYHFLETVYGPGTTTRFIQNLAVSGDMVQAFKKTTNTSLEEAGEIWLRELRRVYWPELGQREYGKSVARRLTQHGRDQSFYNLQPSLSPDGTEIAFFSDRESWEAIYILNVKTEKVSRTVIQSGNVGDHESFRSFKSGISWSPDGKSLAVVSKSGARDVIHILNAKDGKVQRVLRPDVRAVLSPNWSRDGKYIAFSGQRDGFADLYVYDLAADSARRLTHDIANDDKPVFAPSGKWIVFESDRPNARFGGGPDPLAGFDSLLHFKDLYRISINGDSLSLIVGGPWDEKMPSFGPSDSQFVFVSNRSGLDNIYLWQDSAGSVRERPLTNLLTGCFTPSWSRDGKKLAFSLFEAGGWDVFLMSDPLTKVRAQPLPDTLPKTQFIRSAEDTAQKFFRAPTWENLSSFKADSLDSARRAAEKPPKKKSAKQLKAERKKFVADSLKVAAREDSLKSVAVDSLSTEAQWKSAAASTDSLRLSAPKPDSAKVDTVAADSDKSEKKKPEKQKKTPFLTDSTRYLNAEGEFIRRPYEPKWSFDAVNASVGVDNYYGTGGLAFLTLSDLMGDQSIAFALSINGTLENTNLYAEYSYLKYRTDFKIMGFRESQSSAYLAYRQDGETGVFTNNALDRRFGFGVGAEYPFSPFTRVEANLFTRFTERSRTRVLYDSLLQFDSSYSEYTPVDALLPSVAWVHDNAQWGIVGPVAGRRMMAGLQWLPPVFQDSMSYVKADADFRFYKELYKRYTLAFRVSGGMSAPVGGLRNPHQYYVGGESYTFNAHANYDNVPVDLAQFYFSDLDFPLRGYDVFDFRGTRKFVTNAEFRFPFVQELSFVWPIPFAITNVMGSLFVDYGGAWSEPDDRHPLSELGMGMGYGWRMNLGIFVLKYSRAWTVQGMANKYKDPRSYWSLGSEF